MFRVTNTLKTLSINSDALSVNFVNLQIIRWRRKPRWIPTAKSKLFKIPSRPVIPDDEAEELKRLNNNYRTQLKSLKKYLYRRYGVDSESGENIDAEQQQKIFDEDFLRCKELNDKWNASIKAEREAYFEDKLKSDVEEAQQRLIRREEVEKLKFEEAEKVVRALKDEAKTFITSENVDAAIEHALANPVDYNFSIDLEGNRYYGRDTKPDVKLVQENKEKVLVKQ